MFPIAHGLRTEARLGDAIEAGVGRVALKGEVRVAARLAQRVARLVDASRANLHGAVVAQRERDRLL
jgi:hypothetical protein